MTAETAINTENNPDEIEKLKQQLEPIAEGPSEINPRYEAKIILETSEAQIIELMSSGWTNHHMQFSPDGNLQTVWGREHTPQPSAPEDCVAKKPIVIQEISEAEETYPPLNIEIIANKGFKPTPEPVNAVGKEINIEVDSPIPQPDGLPLSNAILKHGIRDVTTVLDTMIDDTLSHVIETSQPKQPQLSLSEIT